jgi:predicted NUDIX family NTP pyrophosphohydrolase
MGEEVRVTTDKSGRTSAGILLWRSRNGRLEVLLAHQGGPFWVKKDIGHWTIPKGEVEPGEEFVAVARREFAEETGQQAPNHPLIDLGQIRQKSGKLVLGWAVQGELDPSTAMSNTYDMEWPPTFRHRPDIPRDRPRRMVRSRRGTPKAEGGASSLPRSASGGPCTRPPIADPQRRILMAPPAINSTVGPERPTRSQCRHRG